MSAFPDIDTSRLPPLDIVVDMGFDGILADMLEKFAADNPEYAASLDFESEPIVALNQAWAYREDMFRKYINTLYKSRFLAFAQGTVLDHMAAFIPLERKDGETDEAFRARIRMAPEGFSTAGSYGAYEFHARNAHADIRDVKVTNPGPGQVKVYILGNGETPAEDLVAYVFAALGDDVRDLCAYVEVEAAAVEPFDIEAEFTLGTGPGAELVMETARAALDDYLARRRAIGRIVTRAAIIDALVVEGVENLNLIKPVADIAPSDTQVATINTIDLREVAHA